MTKMTFIFVVYIEKFQRRLYYYSRSLRSNEIEIVLFNVRNNYGLSYAG